MTLSVQNARDIIAELKQKELAIGANSPQQVQDHLRHIYGAAYIAVTEYSYSDLRFEI